MKKEEYKVKLSRYPLRLLSMIEDYNNTGNFFTFRRTYSSRKARQPDADRFRRQRRHHHVGPRRSGHGSRHLQRLLSQSVEPCTEPSVRHTPRNHQNGNPILPLLQKLHNGGRQERQIRRTEKQRHQLRCSSDG